MSIVLGSGTDTLPICGKGVAVKNGIPAVLEAADYITDSNDADGVAKFIETLLLAEKL